MKKEDGKFYLTNFFNRGDIQICKTEAQCFFGSNAKGPKNYDNLLLSDGSRFSMAQARQTQNEDGSYVYTYNSSKYVSAFFTEKDLTDFINNKNSSTRQKKPISLNGPYFVRISKDNVNEDFVIDKIEVTAFNKAIEFTPESGNPYFGYTDMNSVFNFGDLPESLSLSSVSTTGNTPTFKLAKKELWTDTPVTASGKVTSITSFTWTVTPDTDASPVKRMFSQAETLGQDAIVQLSPSKFTFNRYGTSAWFNCNGALSISKFNVSEFEATVPECAVYDGETNEVITSIPPTSFPYQPTSSTYMYARGSITIDLIAYNETGLYVTLTSNITSCASLISDYDIMVVPGKFSSTNSQGAPALDSSLGFAGAYCANDFPVEETPEEEAAALDDAAADLSQPRTTTAFIPALGDVYGEDVAPADRYFTFYIRYKIPGQTLPAFSNMKQQNMVGPNVSGIEPIESPDTATPAVYYTLQGIRVDNPSNGIFIEVRGNKAIKVVK